MGSEPQKGQYFQSLGATGLTQLNYIWVLKPHIRADEMLNLSDGGLDECVPKGRSHSALMDLLLMVGINAWKKILLGLYNTILNMQFCGGIKLPDMFRYN